MAEIYYKSINRRDFIRTSLAAVGVMVTVGSRSVFGSGKNGKETARWAVLADTHIPEDVSDKYRRFYPYKNLQKVIPQIMSKLPDGVAIAGAAVSYTHLTLPTKA